MLTLTFAWAPGSRGIPICCVRAPRRKTASETKNTSARITVKTSKVPRRRKAKVRYVHAQPQAARNGKASLQVNPGACALRHWAAGAHAAASTAWVRRQLRTYLGVARLLAHLRGVGGAREERGHRYATRVPRAARGHRLTERHCPAFFSANERLVCTFYFLFFNFRLPSVRPAASFVTVCGQR